MKNIYSPPEADLTGGMDLEPAKKPISVTCLQIADVILLGVFLVSLVGALARLPGGVSGPVIMRMLLALAILSYMLSILVTTYRRMPIARVLGGILILMMIGSGIYSVLRGGSASTSTAYSIGHFIGGGAVVALEVYWLYAFAFSEKAKRYFGRNGRS